MEKIGTFVRFALALLIAGPAVAQLDERLDLGVLEAGELVAAAAALIAVLFGMLLLLIRAIAGPTLYDRVLAVNSFGTKTVLALGLLGFVMGRPQFLDIAILYALINFVATIAILKFFRYRSFQVALVRRPGGAGRPTND